MVRLGTFKKGLKWLEDDSGELLRLPGVLVDQDPEEVVEDAQRIQCDLVVSTLLQVMPKRALNRCEEL